MCFEVSSCLCCIKLSTGTKFISYIYLFTSAALMLLFGVSLGSQSLPPERAIFYGCMLTSSGALFVSTCLLIYSAFRECSKLMWPWIVTSLATGVPLVLVCMYGMVTLSFRAEDLLSAAEEAAVISVYFVHALLLLACCMVVNSFRKLLSVREKVAEVPLISVSKSPASSFSVEIRR